MPTIKGTRIGIRSWAMIGYCGKKKGLFDMEIKEKGWEDNKEW